MKLRKGVNKRSPGEMRSDWGVAGPILSTFFASSVIGVAILDAELRFRAVNGTLARMNGVPAAKHIGRKLRYVLGSAASIVEKPMGQVLQTGKTLSNLELTAKLPARAGLAHWIESYIPIRDRRQRVTHLAVFVLETTGMKSLERSLNRMIGNLLQVGATLRTELQSRETTSGWSDEQVGLLPVAIELVEQCIAEAQSINKISRGSSLVDITQPHLAEPNLPGRAGGVRTSRLSLQEQTVLKLLADCKTNKEVAAELGISVRTAETYRGRILRKLDLHSIAQLVRFAVRNKIIEA